MKSTANSSDISGLLPDPLGEQALVPMLRSMVEIDSVNPGTYEQAMAERVKQLLEPTGAEVTAVEMRDGRYSLAAVLEGSGEGPSLVLNGHMDTVPVDDLDDWTVDPFGGTVERDAMFGRGACDMKAGLAIQIAVAHEVAARKQELKGTLILHFAAGEECAEPGTSTLIERGFVGDYGIVTEPTNLEVAVAERGLAHYILRIHGRSAHASQPHLGVNPATYLPAVLEMVERYRQSIQGRSHPLLGPGNCAPTIIQGGTKANTIPSYCDVTVDRRLIPGESIEGELASLREMAAQLEGANPGLQLEVKRSEFGFEPAEIDSDSRFAHRLLELVSTQTGSEPAEVVGTPFASDVSSLVNEGGIEAVTFGPGSIANCHCADEFVPLAQLTTAGAVISEATRELLL